ncbi:hypothetical protein [Caproiciproducens sp. LBM24188]
MKNQKISGVLIYLLVLVLVLLVYFYAVYTPLSVSAVQMDSQHAQNAAQIQLYDSLLSRKAELQEKIDRLQAKVDSNQKKAPIPGEKAAEDVSAACALAGVSLLKVEAGEATAVAGSVASDHKQLYTVPVTVSTACSGEQLLKLLNYFEKQSSGAYYVNQIKYVPGTDQSVLTTELSLSLYYFGPAAKST